MVEKIRGASELTLEGQRKRVNDGENKNGKITSGK